MKAEIQQVWGVYPSDGYTIGSCIAYYPLKAAAEASPENVAQRGYSSIHAVNIIKFDDLVYVFDKQVGRGKVLGHVPTYTPTPCYHDYVYNNGFDGSMYYVGDEELLKTLNDGKMHQIRKGYLLYDGSTYFLLKETEPIKLNSFLMSREIATQHALSKLTEEEKGLLGLK